MVHVLGDYRTILQIGLELRDLAFFSGFTKHKGSTVRAFG